MHTRRGRRHRETAVLPRASRDPGSPRRSECGYRRRACTGSPAAPGAGEKRAVSPARRAAIFLGTGRIPQTGALQFLSLPESGHAFTHPRHCRCRTARACAGLPESEPIFSHLPAQAAGPSSFGAFRPPPQPKPNRAKTRTIWTVRQSRHPDSIAPMQNKPPIAGTRSARALELQKTQNGATLRSRRKPSGELTGCRCQLAVGRGLTSTGTPRTVHRHERRAERGGVLGRIPPRCGFGSSHTRMAYCGLVLRKVLCTIAFWRRKHTRQRHEKPPMRNSAGTAPPHPGRPNPWGSAVDPMQNEPSRRYVQRGGVGGAENPRRRTAPTVPQSVWEFYGRLRPPAVGRRDRPGPRRHIRRRRQPYATAWDETTLEK